VNPTFGFKRIDKSMTHQVIELRPGDQIIIKRCEQVSSVAQWSNTISSKDIAPRKDPKEGRLARNFIGGLKILKSSKNIIFYSRDTILTNDVQAVGWYDKHHYFLRRSHIPMLMHDLELRGNCTEIAVALQKYNYIAVSNKLRLYSYIVNVPNTMNREDVLKIPKYVLDGSIV
jgi:hypothetical protein